MLDMTETTAARSDQLNADDLISGPLTILVTSVERVSDPRQPIHVHYENENGKPWKPCLGMRRILVIGWGKDGHAYVGNSMTLFRNPTVVYSGQEQGGIQISHMSHIEKPIHTMLTISRGKKVPFTAQPLQLTVGPALSADDAKLWKAEIDRGANMAELSATAAKIKSNNYAEGVQKTGVLQHYQTAVTAIREDDAAPVVDNPANMDFPPEDTDTAKEGEVPGL